MNIKLKNLKIKNFLSFGNKLTEYVFESGKVVNVKGKNLDIELGKENASSNGSGKSTIMQAVVYALYGRGVNAIKQDEFINLTNGKDLYVALELECEGKPVKIIRTRKPTSVEFWVDGEDRTRDSVGNTNEAIQRLIGIEYDTFVLSFLMTTAVPPLLRRSPAEQRNFMENLLGVNKLTERAEGVKKIRDRLTVDHKVLMRDVENAERINARERELEEKNARSYRDFERSKEAEIEELEDTIRSYEGFIPDVDEYRALLKDYQKAKDSYEDVRAMYRDKSEEIVRLERRKNAIERDLNERGSNLKAKRSQRVEFSEELMTLERKLDAVIEEIAVHSEKLSLVDTFVSLEEKHDEKTTLLDKLVKEEASLQQDIKALTEEADHLQDSNCPYCKQTWAGEDRIRKIESIRGRIDEKDSKRAAIAMEADDLRKQIAKLEKEIGNIGLTEALCAEILDKNDALDSKKKQLSREIDTLRSRIERLDREIEELESVADSELEEQLEKVDKDIKHHSMLLKDYETEVESLKAMYDVLKARKDDCPFSSESEIDFMLKDDERAKKRLNELRSGSNPFIHPDEYEGKYVVVEEIQEELSKIEQKIEHCKYLIRLLTDSKSFIRKNIIGNYIPYLNKMINTYAARLDSPHTCEIENDLTVSIEYMRHGVSYHSLSAGERLKLDVSVSIALRDLMSVIGIKSGFLMVDELFDSALDTSSKRNVFNLIKDRFDTVLLVSHTSEFDDKCDSLLRVIKENGFSRIEIS